MVAKHDEQYSARSHGAAREAEESWGHMAEKMVAGETMT